VDSGESYVAGGVALNVLTGATRISRDIDLFHYTAEAVSASWQADRKLLESHGYHRVRFHEGRIHGACRACAKSNLDKKRSLEFFDSRLRISLPI
jgi:hypothetical protein